MHFFSVKFKRQIFSMQKPYFSAIVRSYKLFTEISLKVTGSGLFPAYAFFYAANSAPDCAHGG